MDQPTEAVNTPTEVSEVKESQVASLDSYDEFEFQGQKFTPDVLHHVLTEYNDLKSGRDSYAKSAHFYANLPHDLEIVAANPAKAEEFKKAYPDEFHGYLDLVLKRSSKVTDKPQAQENESPIPSKELLDLRNKVQKLESMIESRASSDALSQVNSALDPLLNKYPLAVEETVLLEAEAMANKGMKITPQVWERLVKNSHESIASKSSDYYKQQLKLKRDASAKAKESGLGGSAMGGEPPKKPRSFAEATEAAIQKLSNKG